ncbi:AC9 transposase [Fusarium pseudocircinatum]|uniref:AC9 transposase n=1 Tax=Fusarium pseudocircinatum TaxID=56676 RepID=A0A8H5USA6_9HYPO|nr:AC9 transposase [Fusarium pseudocircinatum]
MPLCLRDENKLEEKDWAIVSLFNEVLQHFEHVLITLEGDGQQRKRKEGYLEAYGSSMVSPTIDLEQWKLLQNFALPTSHPAMASLYDKEAHLAHGRSKDTAIYISSDVESDTDDEDDAS